MKDVTIVDRTEPPFEYETWPDSEPRAQMDGRADSETRSEALADPRDNVSSLLLAVAIFGVFLAVKWFYWPLPSQ
jgi:hypothetical protein